jgi:hypothetical protein
VIFLTGRQDPVTFTTEDHQHMKVQERAALMWVLVGLTGEDPTRTRSRSGRSPSLEPDDADGPPGAPAPPG